MEAEIYALTGPFGMIVRIFQVKNKGQAFVQVVMLQRFFSAWFLDLDSV